MNKRIVPVLSRPLTRDKITVDVEKWKNFAQRITKNSFVKTFLLERDGNKCAWCEREFLEQKIIHHISYEHHCSYDIVIRVPSPSITDPNKTRVVPDCESCKSDNNDRFMACVNKLALVHNFCNKRISEKTFENNKGRGDSPRVIQRNI